MRKANLVLALALLLGAFCPLGAAQNDEAYPPRPANPQAAIQQWLQKSLWAPGSYEEVDWSEMVFMPYGWHFTWAIRHVYIYEHPEYGMMQADDIFYFDPEGAVAGRTNTSHIWRNQAMPVPEWGWGWEKWGPEGKQLLREQADRQRDNIGW